MCRDICWSPGVATPLKRLPLGGLNRFIGPLKRNVFFRNTQLYGREVTGTNRDVALHGIEYGLHVNVTVRHMR